METETFWSLAKDLAHWEFEIFLILIFDVLIGALLWPRIKRFTKHHKKDDDRLDELEHRISNLENKI